MTKPYESIIASVDQSVATVRLNRPDLHNAFNETMIAELGHAFDTLGADPAVRVIVLTGAGESFCAGADLNWMKKVAGYTPKQNLADAQTLHDMLWKVRSCPKAVIARVNGSAIGGGLGLVAAADMAFALDTAVFSFSEVRLGLIPAVISPFVIQKIGAAQASELFLTAERFGAARAKAIALINDLGNADQVDGEISEKIRLLMQAAPGAIAEAKKLIQEVLGSELESAGKITAEKIAARRASPEGQEGIVAFLTKRKPNWVS